MKIFQKAFSKFSRLPLVGNQARGKAGVFLGASTALGFYMMKQKLNYAEESD
jgi:hypothetical protein